MLFLCQQSESVRGGSQHISHTFKTESPKPYMKSSCAPEVFTGREATTLTYSQVKIPE